MRYILNSPVVDHPDDEKKTLTLADWWNVHIKPSPMWQSDTAWEEAFERIDIAFESKSYPIEVSNEDHEKVVQIHRGMDYGRPPGLPQGFYLAQMVSPFRKLARAWTSAPSEKPKAEEPAEKQKPDGVATAPS